MYPLAFPGKAGHLGSIPGSGRSSGEGNGYPHQYSCLDREAWWATVHEVAKQDWATNQQQQIHLKNFTETLLYVKVGKED